MRCLTLGSALQDRGVVVSFVCREHNGHLCDTIARRGFALARLPLSESLGGMRKATPSHAAWLGASSSEDAEQTQTAIGDLARMPDWLVVDHYAIDRRWEQALRPHVRHIMAIDDLADRPHDCDVLLDQNLIAGMATRYTEKVPPRCHLLLGPRYALLQSTFAELGNRARAQEGPVRRIFVYFGGADLGNFTGRTLEAFVSLNRPDIDLDIVVTAGSAHLPAIRQLAAAHPNIHLHSGLATLAPLMARADVAVGAGGATSWERLAMGLYTVVVTLADHQCPIAEELEKLELIRWLGHHDAVSQAELREALHELLDAPRPRLSLEQSRHVGDGHGTDRVCEYLRTTAANHAALK